MEENKQLVSPKPLQVRTRRTSTFTKLVEYSKRRGGKELATIVTDMLELVASGELVYKNSGEAFFD